MGSQKKAEKLKFKSTKLGVVEPGHYSAGRRKGAQHHLSLHSVHTHESFCMTPIDIATAFNASGERACDGASPTYTDLALWRRHKILHQFRGVQ